MSVKLTLPKIIMHFSTFKYSLDLQKIAAASPIFRSIYLEVSWTYRQGFVYAGTGASSEAWWATVSAAAAEPAAIQGLPRRQVTKVLIQQIAAKMLSIKHHWFSIVCATFLIYGVMSDYRYSFHHRGTWQRPILTTLCIVLSMSSLGMARISLCRLPVCHMLPLYIQTYVHAD